jgi:hypothetical protein
VALCQLFGSAKCDQQVQVAPNLNIFQIASCEVELVSVAFLVSFRELILVKRKPPGPFGSEGAAAVI